MFGDLVFDADVLTVDGAETTPDSDAAGPAAAAEGAGVTGPGSSNESAS
jgi:hypothetical protein